MTDQDAKRIRDPSTQSYLGQPGPFGRERCLYALPVGEVTAPQFLKARAVVHDEATHYVTDPQGNLIGTEEIWVPRMLAARWTEDTRRVAG